MGAQYHLWSANEVDALMKQHFLQFWEMYQNGAFPVMRANIARVYILHQYGGMNVDLDVYPNCKSFTQVPLAVQKAKKPTPLDTKSGCVERATFTQEMAQSVLQTVCD